MNVQYLIQLLNNKLNILSNAKVQAYTSGDLQTINTIDQEILDTQNTLSQLTVVQQLTNEAIASNTTTAQIVANGIASNQAAAVIPDSPTAAIANYNMSIYAADPLYIHKLTDILQSMPAMDTTAQIDVYIAQESIGSPLSGSMILAAAQQYNIDTRLLCAILELESNFGTAGVAVSTINPGNVGNTGSATRTYNSWQDGVAAVAQWLSLNPSITSPITPAATPAPATNATTTEMNPNVYTTTTVVPNAPAASTTTNTTSTPVTNPVSNTISNPAPAATSTSISTGSSYNATTSAATSTGASYTGTSATSTNATSTPDVSGSTNTSTIDASTTNATTTNASVNTTASSSGQTGDGFGISGTSTDPSPVFNGSTTLPTSGDSITATSTTGMVPIRRRRV